MSSWPHLDKIAKEKKAAQRWIDSLDTATRARWIDDHVLGEYDWRDWFDAKPSRAFVNEAFTHAQYREEMQD